MKSGRLPRSGRWPFRVWPSRLSRHDASKPRCNHSAFTRSAPWLIFAGGAYIVFHVCAPATRAKSLSTHTNLGLSRLLNGRRHKRQCRRHPRETDSDTAPECRSARRSWFQRRGRWVFRAQRWCLDAMGSGPDKTSAFEVLGWRQTAVYSQPPEGQKTSSGLYRSRVAYISPKPVGTYAPAAARGQ
jgi:hypothetical protein